MQRVLKMVYYGKKYYDKKFIIGENKYSLIIIHSYYQLTAVVFWFT